MEFVIVADGFQFVEAPRVDEQGTVYFSDLTGGGYYRHGLGFSPDGRMLYHAESSNGVWVACWRSARIQRYRPDGVLDQSLRVLWCESRPKCPAYVLQIAACFERQPSSRSRPVLKIANFYERGGRWHV